MQHFSRFNKEILNPIKRYGYVGSGVRAAKILRDSVLGVHMLRRTKEERKSDLKLPSMTTTTTFLDFDGYETDFYESIYKQTRARFDRYVDKGTLLHNYAHIFELLSRLRMAADHPFLVVTSRFRGGTYTTITY